jgi:hypothetical protein
VNGAQKVSAGAKECLIAGVQPSLSRAVAPFENCRPSAAKAAMKMRG